MTIPFRKLKARMLADPKVKAAYDALAPEFELASELIARARIAARLRTSTPPGRGGRLSVRGR